MLTDPQLKSKVDALWDRFWSGGIANPITAIEQISYLVFFKRLEDMDNARAVAAKRKNESYRSVFSAKGGSASGGHGNKECRWSYWSQLPGDQMLKHVRDKVFDFPRELGSDTSSFTQHMQDAVCQRACNNDPSWAAKNNPLDLERGFRYAARTSIVPSGDRAGRRWDDQV